MFEVRSLPWQQRRQDRGLRCSQDFVQLSGLDEYAWCFSDPACLLNIFRFLQEEIEVDDS